VAFGLRGLPRIFGHGRGCSQLHGRAGPRLRNADPRSRIRINRWLAPFAPLPETRDDVELTSTGVPFGCDGHVGTWEAAIVTRFTSNLLGLKNRRYDQKGAKPNRQDRDLCFSENRREVSRVNGRGRTRGGLIVSTTCSSSATLTCVNPCNTDQLVNVPAVIR
jgi:hypothetical protein